MIDLVKYSSDIARELKITKSEAQLLAKMMKVKKIFGQYRWTKKDQKKLSDILEVIKNG